MSASAARVATLLLCSGACALVYQVAWLRELRLVFGASTAATSAVLAIFMGGLAAGGALLGRRADRHSNPLRLYAHLELAVALTAALTPGLLLAVRVLYTAVGGATTLGITGATALRLLLSALVLGLPTFLMGGTLPAAARAVGLDSDLGRRRLALLYGSNTLGAVAGAATSTFLMLEVYGTRQTLWLACLVNALVGITARSMARALPDRGDGVLPAANSEPQGAALPRERFVLAAAATVGFAFLLMELVWYRMLGPLLGGSTYTFGLILAVALAGIGCGSAAYSLRSQSSPATLYGFALTCGLEGLLLVLPLAVGDRIAVVAALLHPLGTLGLSGQVLGWSLVAAMVVLPAAIVSGYQFPLLVGLLGTGRRGIGRHTGLAYAWNTGGAILGSLAGGFLLIPGLGAVGSWRLATLLLVLLGATASCLRWMEGTQRRLPIAAAAVITSTTILLFADGPSAAWRQSPIGAGRVSFAGMDQNDIHDWVNRQRRNIAWQADGVESSVAISDADGIAFLINGKVDGNARGDAATQVVFGLVGAALHPHPTKALVIGLGTGSSAGWLAEIDSMKRVDVVELEPDVVEVARRCSAVNRHALEQPAVNLIIGDAREVLLTSPEQYDLVISEPSNPYRAGIASLYTREFYRAVSQRLAPHGIFSQWVQGYEVDSRTVRTIMATLATVFPSVETWQTKTNDMLFLCSKDPLRYRAPELRERLGREPFSSALTRVWGTPGLEGLLAHHIAGPDLARSLAEQDQSDVALNTDDRMLVEFGFARTMGRRRGFFLEDVQLVARQRGLNRPTVEGGPVSWSRVSDNRLLIHFMDGVKVPPGLPGLDPAQQARAEALNHYLLEEYGAALAAWNRQPRAPLMPPELLVVAHSLAAAGDESFMPLFADLEAVWPIDAAVVRATFEWRRGSPAAAVAWLGTAITQLRQDPWAQGPVILFALKMAREIAEQHPAVARELYELLSAPFAASVHDERRLLTMLDLAKLVGPELQARTVHLFEPHVPWTKRFLATRALAYRAAGDPLADQAETDLESFLAQAPERFGEGLDGR